MFAPGVLVAAHRGASAETPESTRAAIRRAVALGVQMIELDVQLTHDNRLVVFHDERLERTTTGSGRLIDWSYRELARLDAGSWCARRFAGQRILLVSQALRAIPPPCLVNLELKPTQRPTLLIHRVVRCVTWTRMISRVLFSSFDRSLLSRVGARAPRVARALLCKHDATRALREACRLGCVALHPHVALINRALIARAHAAGLRVHAWTVDRPREAQRLIQFGVDGIVTNRPDVLRSVCRSTRANRGSLRG